MGVLIDPSVLFEHERGRLDAGPHLDAHAGAPFFLSVVSAAELLRGVQLARTSRARSLRAAFAEAVVQRFPLLPVDLGSARTHARLSVELGELRRSVGAADLWLAAQAVANGLVLAVGEPRELGRVPGLRLESWLAGGG